MESVGVLKSMARGSRGSIVSCFICRMDGFRSYLTIEPATLANAVIHLTLNRPATKITRSGEKGLRRSTHRKTAALKGTPIAEENGNRVDGCESAKRADGSRRKSGANDSGRVSLRRCVVDKKEFE